ncbi:cupin domain-containing protein [Mameliella sp. CS4]|uniref:cupin domain-containing protein n=1 Tax=Mameliella sp. CS4 TaxID=2862329 RepID=UPI001C5CF82B|nr:cupin domain-containing protein [Mameliella sp. CS4]MBW4984247.1 cupin domain-containing protein [Mameliella sp. CS4]
MTYQLLYSDDEGESHWRDVAVPLSKQVFAPPAQDILVSGGEAAKSMVWLKLEAGWDEPVHPTPKRQLLICLSGRIRVTASDGEAREFGQGDCWRMEDTFGKGHHTRVISETDFDCAIVQFD